MAGISSALLKRVAASVLIAIGLKDEDATAVADSILYANRIGIHSHGIGRLPLYARMIELGLMQPDSPMNVPIDRPNYALIDAGDGMGQIAALKALELGIPKAMEHGISVIGIKNSNNFGASGYFGQRAAERGMIALILANAAPAIAPTGGTKPLFGTNPLCAAFPGDSNECPPIVIDMALTTAARGKIRWAAKLGQRIPFGWACDENGQPTDDPVKALSGSLLPIGDYKGYLLSMMIDMLAGMITGSAFAGEVRTLSDEEGPSRSGHLFVFIHPHNFISAVEYQQRVNTLVSAIKASGEEGAIHIPGAKYAQALSDNDDWIDLPEKQMQEIDDLAESLGIELRLRSKEQ